MKSFFRSVVLLLLVPAVMTLVGCGDKEEAKVRVFAPNQFDWTNESPVGELVHDSRLMQPVVLSEDLVSRDWSIGVLLATYARRNHGTVEIALEQDTRRHIYLDSASLEDNTFGFLDVPAGDFHAGPATLVVRGLEGELGSSPTAWTYTPNPGVPTFILNGQEDSRALCYKFFIYE